MGEGKSFLLRQLGEKSSKKAIRERLWYYCGIERNGCVAKRFISLRRINMGNVR